METQKFIFLFKSNLICVFAALSFAMGFPAVDVLLNDWGVISVVLVRNLIAFLFILFIWLLTENYASILRAKWLKGFVIGALGFGLGSLLLVITQLLTSTFIAALAAALMPLSAITLEIFFDGRRINVKFFIGIMLVLGGSAIILGTQVLDVKFSMGLLIGIISVTFFAWGSRASVKYLPDMTTLARTATTTLGMTGFCLTIYLISIYFEFGATDIPKIKTEHLKLLIIYACFGLAVSQILWIHGVQKLGIGIASLHLNITPFYVMILLFVIGYEWFWIQAIGAITIIFGISMTQLDYNKNKSVNFKSQ